MIFDGYFTDPDLIKTAGNPAGMPLAIHMESQGSRWFAGNRFTRNRHGELCAAILKGPLWHQNQLPNCFLMDIDPLALNADSLMIDDENLAVKTNPILNAASSPDVRVITLSTSSREHTLWSVSWQKWFWKADQAVVLKAAGNDGADWEALRAGDRFCGLYSMPGFLRVGEAFADGRATPNSQASGPAFITSHPFFLDPAFNFRFAPNQQELDAFRDTADKTANSNVKDPYETLLGSDTLLSFIELSAGGLLQGGEGTSFAAPHAGAQIMATTPNCEGISAFDIIPAVLLAAMENPPPALDSVITNAAGFRFDQGQYGAGTLTKEALKEKIAAIEEIRKSKNYCSQDSQPITVDSAEGSSVNGDRGVWRIKAENSKGFLLNTAFTLSFRGSLKDIFRDTRETVPSHVYVTSPMGTRIDLKLLPQECRHGAGFSTTAFFGEQAKGGDWIIECPRDGKNFKIAGAHITTHSLRPNSPGAQLLNQFNRNQGLHKALH